MDTRSICNFLLGETFRNYAQILLACGGYAQRLQFLQAITNPTMMLIAISTELVHDDVVRVALQRLEWARKFHYLTKNVDKFCPNVITSLSDVELMWRHYCEDETLEDIMHESSLPTPTIFGRQFLSSQAWSNRICSNFPPRVLYDAACDVLRAIYAVFPDIPDIEVQCPARFVITLSSTHTPTCLLGNMKSCTACKPALCGGISKVYIILLIPPHQFNSDVSHQPRIGYTCHGSMKFRHVVPVAWKLAHCVPLGRIHSQLLRYADIAREMCHNGSIFEGTSVNFTKFPPISVPPPILSHLPLQIPAVSDAAAAAASPSPAVLALAPVTQPQQSSKNVVRLCELVALLSAVFPHLDAAADRFIIEFHDTRLLLNVYMDARTFYFSIPFHGATPVVGVRAVYKIPKHRAAVLREALEALRGLDRASPPNTTVMLGPLEHPLESLFVQTFAGLTICMSTLEFLRIDVAPPPVESSEIPIPADVFARLVAVSQNIYQLRLVWSDPVPMLCAIARSSTMAAPPRLLGALPVFPTGIRTMGCWTGTIREEHIRGARGASLLFNACDNIWMWCRTAAADEDGVTKRLIYSDVFLKSDIAPLPA